MAQESHYKRSASQPKLKSKNIPLRATHYQSFEMLSDVQPNSQKPPPSPFPSTLPTSKQKLGRHSRTNSTSSVQSFDALQASTGSNFSFEASSAPTISSDAWINEISPTNGNVFYIELQPILRRKKHHNSSLSLSSAISDMSISSTPAPKGSATPGTSPSLSRKRKLKFSKLFPSRAQGRKKQTSTPNPVRISTISLGENKIQHKSSLEASRHPVNLTTNSIKLHLEQPLTSKSGEQITKQDILTKLGIIVHTPVIRPARSVDDLLDSSSHASKKLTNNPVIIKSLKPDSQAYRDGQLRSGDIILAIDNFSVTQDNLLYFLDKLKYKTDIAIDINREAKPEIDEVNYDAKRREYFIRLVTRQESFESIANAYLTENPKGLGTYLCMYNTLSETKTEGKKDGMEDLLFYYPYEPIPTNVSPAEPTASGIHKLVAIRGVFYTLADTLQSICGLPGENASMKMSDGEVVRSVFKLLPNKEIIVIIAPDKVITVDNLLSCLEKFLNILSLLFGNVRNAFVQATNHQDLIYLCDLLYAHIYNTILFDPYDVFISTLMACQSLRFHSEIETEINALLSELDAMDLSDQPEVRDMQRPYHTIGSCLYYKGYLICSHLPVNYQKDVNFFCSFHGLLNLTSTHSTGQIVIWREIFPSQPEGSTLKTPTEKSLDFKSLGGKFFLLIVGTGQSICAQILLAGPMATRLLDKPPPDPLFIDRIKEMLEELDRYGLLADLEDKSLNAPHIPSITNPLATSDNTSDKYHTDRGLRGSRGSLRTSGDSTDSDGSTATKTQSRSSLNLLDIQPHQASSKVVVFDSIAFLTSSPINLLFHYLVFDEFSGVFLSPPSFSKNPKIPPSIQKDIVRIFHSFCLFIQQKFKRSQRYAKSFAKLNKRFKSVKMDDPQHISGELEECGFKFEWSVKSSKDQPTIIFWVVGRRILRPKPCELYICYQDSTPQSTVEMAFKLLQSNII